MRFIYNDEIYDDNYLEFEKDISDLLVDLEENNEIESSITTVYNVKSCDGYYTDNETEDFLEHLIDMDIIQRIDK